MLLFPHKAFKISYFASLSKTALTVAYIPDDIRARQVKYHLQSISQIIDCHHKGNEADYLMKNYEDQGGCYPSRP